MEERSTRSVIIAWIILFSIAVIVLSFTIKPRTVSAGVIPTGPDSHVITANGQAVVAVAPDMATISIGVTTESDDVIAAQKENTRKMGAVTESLKADGIKEEDMKTSNYSISPKRTWDELKRENIVTGYMVVNTVSVTVNDVSRIGEIVDGVVAVGGNQINGISFGVKDESGYYNEALEMAVKDAKDKAAAMGKGIDAKNIRAMSIVESGARNQPIAYDSMRSMDMAEQTTPIFEGEMEIRASVTVEFGFSY